MQIAEILKWLSTNSGRGAAVTRPWRTPCATKNQRMMEDYYLVKRNRAWTAEAGAYDAPLPLDVVRPFMRWNAAPSNSNILLYVLCSLLVLPTRYSSCLH